jgi:RNA polymerase sigma factor (sigma-70 family)
VEASTLQAPTGLARHRIAIGIPLLRLRSDEQLVALFRAGHDEAFRVIHDRYEKRLLAYARQMLPRGHDAEDALQDVFVRAYSGLRSSERELALRAWLFRVAHNRCIDELRRPAPPPPEVLQLAFRTVQDPVAEADRRESLRRLIADMRRLPDQQRSALLMREMGGMSYAELATTLGTSVPAVKSLLVRARIALVQAAAARDTACSEIREELVGAHDRGVRPNANAKRHIRDCTGCNSFKRELRTINRRVAALAPLGPLALLAKTLGLSGGAGASSSATASGAGGATAGGATAGGAAGGATALGGAAGGGSAIAGGALVVGTGHVATLLAAAVATAGGAVAISAPPAHPHVRPPANVQSAAAPLTDGGSGLQAAATQDAAATAVGVSLLDQSKAAVAARATQARIRHKPPRTAPASSSSTIPATTAPATTSSTDGTSTDPNAGTTLGTTLNGGTDPNATGTSPSDSGSTGTSSGTGATTGTGTTSSGSQPSGSSPSSSTTDGSSGSTSNTTNSGTSGSSGNGPETSPDTYSKPGTSGSTSSSTR